MIDEHYFDDRVTAACGHLTGDEVLLASVHSESTAFTRFNEARVRQAGTVEQSSIEVDLIEGSRHTRADLTLTGDPSIDDARLAALLALLREQRAVVPEDPHLLVNTEATASHRRAPDRLPPPDRALDAITAAAGQKDLVGIYTAGAVASGFANSLGQRNWHETSTFNFDWTFYLRGDKAVKSNYSDFAWDDATFDRKVAEAEQKLAALDRPPIDLAPGEYRVLLTPEALAEVIELVAWSSFGLRAQRTSQSALLRLLSGDGELSPTVHMTEDTAGGIAPNFQEQGFLRPDRVSLIDGGRAADALVSPRSAVEFGVPSNGAAGDESPRSLSIAAGSLGGADALGALDEGLSIGNLWYTNFSDRPACRVTGMTRFATFWVEGGEIAAPVNVLRFDDTLYHLLGAKLSALTDDAEFIFDNSTYVQRTSASIRLPGALVDGMRFTL